MLLITLSEIILSLGVKVKTKKSFEPNFSFISWRYLRSGSPSIKSVSDDASNLKSLELYQKIKLSKL